MGIGYLLEGLILGFAYAMPIGAQNIFVIHSAACHGVPKSFKTALIVSVIDVSLGLTCFFGIGAIIDRWSVVKLALLACGSFFLFYYGFKLLLKSSNEDLGDRDPGITSISIFKTAFILTWFNPQAIIDGSMLFGTSRASLPSVAVWPFLVGIMIASPIWFFFITAVIGGLQKMVSKRTFLMLNRGCGFVLIFFAVKFLSVFIGMVV